MGEARNAEEPSRSEETGRRNGETTNKRTPMQLGTSITPHRQGLQT